MEENFRRKYLIYPFNFWCIIIQMLFAIIFPVIFLVHYIDDTILFLSVITFINIVVWYLSREFLLYPKEIILTKNTITINHLSLNKMTIRRTILIPFDKISRFSGDVGSDMKFKLILIYPYYTITFYKHNIWGRKDDFEQLVHDFEKLVNNYNLDQQYQQNDMNIRPNRIKFGDKSALYQTIFCFVFSAILLLMFINSIGKEELNYMSLIGGILFIWLGTIYLKIYKRVKENE